MEIRVGRHYMRRNNTTAHIVSKDTASTYPFVCQEGYSYASDGTYDVVKVPHLLDLMFEVGITGRPFMEEFKEKTKPQNSTAVPMSLIPLDLLQGLARVLELEANFNWRSPSEIKVEIDSLLCHLTKLQEGYIRDDLSDLPHLDHMIFNLLKIRLRMMHDGILNQDPGCGRKPNV